MWPCGEYGEEAVHRGLQKAGMEDSDSPDVRGAQREGRENLFRLGGNLGCFRLESCPILLCNPKGCHLGTTFQENGLQVKKAPLVICVDTLARC